MVLQDPVPTFGVEIRFVHNTGEPIRQRRDDAVGGAGHPARVGGAPEDVRRMEIERKFARDVVGRHGAMHVEGPLGCSGRAAGEMQECRVFRIGGSDSIGVRVLFQQLMKILRPWYGGRTSFVADE